MAQQQDSLTTTLELRARKFKDLLEEQLPLIQGFKTMEGGRDMVDGGARKGYPVVVTEHAGIVEHQTGYEPTIQTVAEISQLAYFDLDFFSTVVAITKKDKAENKGKAAQLSMLDMRMKAQMKKCFRDFEAHYLRDQGTFANLLSLDGMSTGNTTGFLEENAVGAQTNTVGELSKATPPPYLDNFVYDIAGAFSTNGINMITEGHTDISMYREGPNRGLFLMEKAMFVLYVAELETQRRFYKRDVLDSGMIEMVDSNGVVCRPTPNLGYTDGSGTRVSGILLDVGGIFEIVDKDYDWVVEPPEGVSGSIVIARDILRHSQLGFQGGLRHSTVFLRGNL